MTNRNAFLATIAYSEVGPELISISDAGYNVLVGSTPQKPLLFDDYSKHPRILNRELNSTAAGLYQIIYPTWLGLCKNYGFTDFFPDSQDIMALDLITEHNAIDDVDAGRFEDAIFKCSAEWASLPGSDSGQHQNHMLTLKNVYIKAGGTLT